jgi:putative oxidoreductase
MVPNLSPAADTVAAPLAGYRPDMALTRKFVRPLLGAFFVANGVDSLRNAEAIAREAKPVTDRFVPIVERAAPDGTPVPTEAVTWVRINGAVQIAAAAALATGRFPRLASGVLAGSLVPSTAARYRFWEASDPAQRREQLTHFFKNVSLTGGLLIAAGDTEGRPGVAWRARRASRDARRETRQLAHAAKREVKLVKAQLT